jgi:hypothetical protein
LRDTTPCQMGQNSTHETIMSLRDVTMQLQRRTLETPAREQNNASLEAIRQDGDRLGIGDGSVA